VVFFAFALFGMWSFWHVVFLEYALLACGLFGMWSFWDVLNVIKTKEHKQEVQCSQKEG
jgi:hypothetical protein